MHCMRFVIDQVEVALDAQEDDTIEELKEKFGRPVYFYAKKYIHMTALDIYNLFGRPLSADELRTVFLNLNISKEVTKSVYTLPDLIDLELGHRHAAWVALGQAVEAGRPVVPGHGDAPPAKNAVLLDYLPIIDDTVYGVTDAYTLPLTRSKRPDITGLVHNSAKFFDVARLLEGVHSVHLVLKSISNISMPLDYLFKVLHATKDVPLIGRGNRYRVHAEVEGKVDTFNGLTCWFDTGGWVTATFYRDGHVEILFQCPETVMVPLGSLETILHPVNKFIRCVNNTLRWGTTLESDLRVGGTYRSTEGFPCFESVEQSLRTMSYMYATDFITSRDIAPNSPLHEVLKRVAKCSTVLTSAESTILRVELTTTAALDVLRTYAAAYMYELWVSDTHSYTFRQPKKVRLQTSVDTDSQEYPWNLPRMTYSTPTLAVLRGTQVGPPNLATFDKLPASLQQYLGPKFYLHETPTASSPFLQCIATHMSLTNRPMTVDGVKSLIIEKAKAVFPLYPNLVLQFSTNMTSSVRNHIPFVNFKNYIESEESIDFAFVWDIVCSRILNANLVVFNGDNPVSGKVEIIAPCSETLDPSRETVLLLKHNGTFDLVYESVKQFDGSYPFIDKVSKLYATKSSPNLSAGEVLRKLRGAKYRVLHQITHLNQTIGFLAARNGVTGLVPCYPAEVTSSPPCQDVQYLPATSGVEVDTFLKEVHSATRLPCVLTHLVKGGAMTERYLFVHARLPCPHSLRTNRTLPMNMTVTRLTRTPPLCPSRNNQSSAMPWRGRCCARS